MGKNTINFALNLREEQGTELVHFSEVTHTHTMYTLQRISMGTIPVEKCFLI